MGRSRLLSDFEEVRLELIDNRLGLEVEDLDARSGSGAQPVSVGGEGEGVDGVSSFERVQVLSFIKIPEHATIFWCREV